MVMKKHVNKIRIIFILFTTWLQGQNFTEDPINFSNQLKQLFAGTKSEQNIFYASQLESLINGKQITEEQKLSIIKQFQLLQKKKLKVTPHMVNLAAIIAFAINKQNISGKKLDSLFLLNFKIIETNQIKLLENYLNTMKTFMEYRAFYYGNYNYTKLIGGELAFLYKEGISDKDIVELKEEEKNTTKPTNQKEWYFNWSDSPNESVVEERESQIQNDWDIKIPNLVGSIIKVKQANIVIGTKFDSCTIYNTNGTFLIESKKYIGDNGRTDWKAGGIPDIRVEFNKFILEVNKPEVEAYNVKFYYPSKVENELKGNFVYKAEKKTDSLKITYPRFVSFESNVKVKNIGQNLIYTGGFTLNGNRIYSNSLDGKKTKIELIENGIKKFKAISYSFELSETEINSPLTSIVMYYGKDSVSHPGVAFNFQKTDSKLTLLNQNSSYRNTPFLDTYHKMELLAEMVTWKTNTPRIDFSMITGRSENPMKVTSIDYFDEKFYDKMKGLYTFHPLQLAINYTRELKKNEFYSDELANKYKLNPIIVNTAMKDLNRQGFIEYQEGGKYKILNKGYHYYISKEGKKDFDQIKIQSKETKTSNGTLDMQTNELIIRGVEQFPLSEKLNIYLRPNDKEIRILKNRDFIFDGIVIASDMLIFFGKKFRFDYDSFFVNLTNIDSLKLRIRTKEKDKDGKFIVKDLKSQIESSAGILYINKPFNKSAKKIFAEYPIFKSYKGSFVYYDDPTIFNGIYGKKIYFEIPPFTIDSLTSYEEPYFEGIFKTNGIFPDIKERITVMPEDLSLGFEHKIPEGGYPVYNGKAKFYKRIKISNDGLRGNGYLEYLTGTYYSDDFVFYPDSLVTVGTMATIKEGKVGKANFADAVVGQYDLKWIVDHDTLVVHNYADAFQMYKGTCQFNGKIFASNKGMFGEGIIETRGSESYSKSITFEQEGYYAREAYFRVNSQDPKKPAVEAKNIKLDFDFKNSHCYFSPEIVGTAANEFPYLQYKTSMEGGNWDLKNKIITFQKDKDKPIHTSYFVSIHPEQDSLLFFSTKAMYDMEKQVLTIEGVPFIFTCNSKIFPDKNKVVIRENANMEMLENARLQIDSTKKWYNLYKGQIKILGKNEFKGEALYDFYNSDSAKFVLKFSNFEFKDPSLIGKNEEDLTKKDLRKLTKKNIENYVTTAVCEILPKDTFRLAPKIIFQGNCRLRADRPALQFDGEVRLDLKAYKGNEQWLKYTNDGTTNNIDINIKNAKANDGTPLATGLFLDLGTYQIYSAFLSKLKANDDKPILKASDYLIFDNQKAIFKIGDVERLSNKKLDGSIFSYDDKSSKLYYAGKINTFDNIYKDFEVLTSTIGEGQADSAKFNFNLLLAIKMNLPTQALEQMAKTIKSLAQSFDLEKITINRDTTAQMVADIAGSKAGEDFKKSSALENKPIFEYAKILNNYITILETKFKWSQKHNCFYSDSKLNLANILKSDVGYKLDGFIEIKKTPHGDLFYMYLEPAPGYWYFFVFEQNKLATLSSDESFNKIISTKSKGELSKGRYYFILADELEKDLFLKDFYKNFLNKEYEIKQNQEHNIQNSNDGGY